MLHVVGKNHEKSSSSKLDVLVITFQLSNFKGLISRDNVNFSLQFGHCFHTSFKSDTLIMEY